MSGGGEPTANAPNRNMSSAVASSLSWTIAIYFIQTAVQLGFTAVLSRILSPREYGIVAAANVFIQFANVLANVGVNAAIIQMPEIDWHRQRVAYGIVLASSLLCVAAMLAVAPFAQAWFQMDGLADVVRVLSLVFVGQAVGAVSQSLLYRELENRRVILTQLAAVLFANLVVAIPMAWFGYGYWSLVGATLAQVFLTSILLRLQVRAPLLPVFSWREARGLLRTSVGFSVAEIIGFAALQGDNVVVGRFIGSEALGIYSRAYNLMTLPTSMYGAIAERVVFPAMARVQNDLVRLRSAYIRGIAITSFVGVQLTALVIVVAPELIRIIFGHKWIGVIRPFEILSLAMYLRLSWRVSSSLLKSRGHVGRVVLANAVQATLVIGGCLATYRYGLDALSAAVGLSFFVGYAVVSAFACHTLRVTLIQFLRVQRPGFALGALVAVLSFVTSTVLRDVHAPDYSVLAAVLLVAGGGALAGVIALPSVFVGPNVAPFLAEMLQLVRRRAAISG